MGKNDTSDDRQGLLSERQKREIVEHLQAKGVRAACPMCGERSWVVMDGYFNEGIQGNLEQGLVIGGPSIPSIGLVCSNCGFVSRHALGALGLLKNDQEDE